MRLSRMSGSFLQKFEIKRVFLQEALLILIYFYYTLIYMEKKDFINDFISKQNIKLDSELNPIMIFDERKKIVLINNKFRSTFKENYKSCKPDYFFIKEKEEYRYFSDFDISDLLTGRGNIFIYRTEKETDLAFDILTLHLGTWNNNDYYISLFFNVSDFRERLIDETMHALVKASQMKDNDTGEHIYRLNEYSQLISQYIFDNHSIDFPEIDDYFIERIGKVAAMHDIGKIGIPDYILTKPDKLSDEEFAVMKEHTINGAFILSELAGKMARDIALFHHEKWNGTGYPYGLKEIQIPLSARIVALADVYDALRMKRCYKPSFSQEKTISIITENKGVHFDPDLTEIFLKVSEQFNDIFQNLNDESEVETID